MFQHDDDFINDLEMLNTFEEPEVILSGEVTELTNEQKAILAEIKDQRENEYTKKFDQFTNDLFDSLNF
jgi:hypothetical protein